MLGLEKALELVGDLSRTRNYPRDEEGLVSLAKGLQRASDAAQIAAKRIVERCGEVSEWCPSDADLLSVARELAMLDKVAAGTYDSTAGAGNAARPMRHTYGCALCKDTGWEIVYMLHTPEGGNSNYVKKQRLTEGEAEDLSKKLDWKRQQIYSGARKCKCPVPQDVKMFAAGDGEA